MFAPACHQAEVVIVADSSHVMHVVSALDWLLSSWQTYRSMLAAVCQQYCHLYCGCFCTRGIWFSFFCGCRWCPCHFLAHARMIALTRRPLPPCSLGGSFVAPYTIMQITTTCQLLSPCLSRCPVRQKLAEVRGDERSNPSDYW